ncbi:MAG TPA: hypothetical protein PK239_06345 [Chitinophagales bacterium]|nr:hypothetical protein [Chitinophagales bacterium]HRK26895.1 hypothetical protein [Chitinophagales bacterium]
MFGNILSAIGERLTPPGNTGKLTIHAFADVTFLGSGVGLFTTPINPVSFSETLKINYNKEQAAGSQWTNLRYTATPPESLELEFTLDGTGAVPNSGTVAEQILRLKNTVYFMVGNIHRPNYLVVTWGTYVFRGVMEEMKITYTLFKPDGTPLRAKINTKFLNAISHAERINLEGKNSSDLTHERMVMEGDSLPLMTHKIYNDAALYTKVARFNNLVNFRNLKPGTRLKFPPKAVLDTL